LTTDWTTGVGGSIPGRGKEFLL